MRLRELEQKDAPFMLEWMHDDFVVHDMQTNFMEKTFDDCKAFIAGAADTSKALHLAITDENDEYMGTVSLKHITKISAEFAITIRRCAMGKGYSARGMREIIWRGFHQRGLEYIYWCVNPANQRAIRFYDKNGYNRYLPGSIMPGYTQEQMEKYLWYKIDRKFSN